MVSFPWTGTFSQSCACRSRRSVSNTTDQLESKCVAPVFRSSHSCWHAFPAQRHCIVARLIQESHSHCTLMIYFNRVFSALLKKCFQSQINLTRNGSLPLINLRSFCLPLSLHDQEESSPLSPATQFLHESLACSGSSLRSLQLVLPQQLPGMCAICRYKEGNDFHSWLNLSTSAVMIVFSSQVAFKFMQSGVDRFKIKT